MQFILYNSAKVRVVWFLKLYFMYKLYTLKSPHRAHLWSLIHSIWGPDIAPPGDQFWCQNKPKMLRKILSIIQIFKIKCVLAKTDVINDSHLTKVLGSEDLNFTKNDTNHQNSHQGLLLPHQSVQVCACSRGGLLLRTVCAKGPLVASHLFGWTLGPSLSWPWVSTTLEHLYLKTAFFTN